MLFLLLLFYSTKEIYNIFHFGIALTVTTVVYINEIELNEYMHDTPLFAFVNYDVVY